MGDHFIFSDNLTKDLQIATADLHQVDPLAGLFRFSVIGVAVLSLVALAWSTPNNIVFLGSTILAGGIGAFWFICTHDAVHHTLTGWVWFETLAPRLISWPLLWPYGLYAELHRLHHGWNGINLLDPERVQWTYQEYQCASPVLRWYVRRQWMVDIFILGGIGMIIKTIVNALRFQTRSPGIRLQLLLDMVGILLVQGTLLTLATLQGEALRYLLFWFILERVIGMVIQARDHLEHYALWGKVAGHQITQLYACRNLKASPLVGWLMGGLNYHAVHHAFPGIPFNLIPVAFQRIQAVLQQHDLPLMKLEEGYLKELYRLSRQPSLIGEVNQVDFTGRHRMIPVG